MNRLEAEKPDPATLDAVRAEREKIARWLDVRLGAIVPPWNPPTLDEVREIVRRIRDGDYR